MAEGLMGKVMANIYSLIIGIIFVIGGASGEYVLRGFGGLFGQVALIIVGLAILAYAAYNIFTSN
ncbi:MAG: hypothetical protein FWH54_01755 [Methanobrevibacter sp.]|nr:hypothetical protein [Methanobrevibacter sp.]